MKTEWNLDIAMATLAKLTKPDRVEEIATQLSQLEVSVAEQKVASSLTEQAQETLECMQRIDHQLDSVHALASLMTLNKVSPALPSTLKDLTQRFIHCIDTIIERADMLQSPMREWYQSLTPELKNGSLASEFRNIANGYLNGLNPEHLLLHRIRMDPEILALEHRLQQQALLTGPLFTEQHQHESQEYWNNLLNSAGKKRASLSEARDTENRSYGQTAWSIDQALDVLCCVLKELHPHAVIELQALKNEGRLRISRTDQNNDLCLDTPIGCFVQVYFDGSIQSLLRLTHEAGHAIQQAIFRKLPHLTPALNPLDSEVWAIRAERLLLNYLERQMDTEQAARSLRLSRAIELNHRHRMLHSFEIDLHESHPLNIQAITDLWLERNQRYYGNRIDLEKDFHDAWLDIHHLFTAPFYLMIYPLAYEKESLLKPLPGLE